MRFLAAGLLGFLIFAAPLVASTIEAPAVEYWMQIADNAPTEWWPTGTANGDDTFDYGGTRTDNIWEVTWDITVDVDPFIDALITVKNPTSSTQTYTFTVILPVSPIAAPTWHGGSVAATLLDANFDASAIDPDELAVDPISGQAMYIGMIDMTGVLSLLPPDPADVPLSVTTAGGVDTASKVAGLPGPTLPSGAVTTSIGIQHKFTLTAGDNGTFNSLFVVIPEPATLGLLLLGGLVLLRRRRK